jgi:hypothetical protein
LFEIFEIFEQMTLTEGAQTTAVHFALHSKTQRPESNQDATGRSKKWNNQRSFCSEEIHPGLRKNP